MSGTCDSQVVNSQSGCLVYFFLAWCLGSRAIFCYLMISSFLLEAFVFSNSGLRHKNQLQDQQVQKIAESGELANFANLLNLRLVYSTSVYLVFLIVICLTMAAFENDSPSITLKRFSLSLWTLVYLNLYLNPVSYC